MAKSIIIVGFNSSILFTTMVRLISGQSNKHQYLNQIYWFWYKKNFAFNLNTFFKHFLPYFSLTPIRDGLGTGNRVFPLFINWPMIVFMTPILEVVFVQVYLTGFDISLIIEVSLSLIFLYILNSLGKPLF